MHEQSPHPQEITFAEFYELYYFRTVHYICGKIGNLHDAEDLAGDIFLYCYHHYAEYDPQKSKLSTWLYLIVNSRIKNHYRDARSFVDLESVVGTLPDDGESMDACLYLEQKKLALESAIAKLSERDRAIVTLRYFEDKSSTEIAKLLHMSPGNVRVRLSRALEALSRTLSQQGHFKEE